MSKHRPTWLILAISLLLVAGCKSKNKSKKAPKDDPVATESAPTTAPTTTATDEPALPAVEKTPAVLRGELGRLVDAREPGLEAAITRDLVLPEAPAFFARTFGDEVGAALATEYETQSKVVSTLANTIRVNQSKHKRHKITVETFTDSTDPRATGYQARALAAMAEPVPLYSVRYSSLGKSGELHIYNFVHDGQRFRYVGPLAALAPGGDAKVLHRRQGAGPK